MQIKDILILAIKSGTTRSNLRPILEENFNVLEASNEEQLTHLLEQNQSNIATVLIEISMLSKNGKPLLSEIQKSGLTQNIPLISIITKNSSRSEKLSIELGASEIITMPFNPTVIKHRIGKIVSSFQNQNTMQSVISEQASEMHSSYEAMLDILSSLIEHRNIESGQHVLRIRRFTKILLEEISRACPEYGLSKTDIDTITSASALHDIGKISIPDAILNKPGKLTDEEFELMKTHVISGSDILEGFKDIGNEGYLRYAYNICRYHHERWDGGGYPDGLVGDNIPICAQVVGLADAYDALTTTRVYKDAVPPLEAVNMIFNGECGEFSPKLLECFKHVLGIFEELSRSYADGYSPKNDTVAVPLAAPQKDVTDSMQTVVAKYRALIHHFNITAVEIDADSDFFHILYDPFLTFEALKGASSFEKGMNLIAEQSVHPDDRHLITEHLHDYITNFFESGLRKTSRHYRIKDSDGVYRKYEATILRIRVENSDKRHAIAIWRRMDKTTPSSSTQKSISNEFTFSQRFICNSNLTLSPVNKNFINSLGYDVDEFAKEYNNSFAKLIPSEQRESIYNVLMKQLAKSNYVEVIMTLLHKNGDRKMYLAKGGLYQDKNGIQYIDATYLRCDLTIPKYSQKLSQMQLYKTIVDQIGDVLFEWDIATDTLTCSQKWREHFGYDNISQNASVNIPKSTHIHPDDVEIFQRKYHEIVSGEYHLAEAILRFANSQGQYLYNRVRITAIKDESGKVTKLVGLISDVDDELRHSQQLLETSERDSLTKMLNKEACRKRIDFYFSNNPEITGGVLMIIDIDNFKDVNDRFGHMFGDTVLTNIAEEIKSLFRENDIMARIGGDEFLVFMPNVTDHTFINSRCNELIDAISSLYPQESGIDISCSIGVSFVPEHGMVYSELFKKADIALYQAKSNGKNTFVFYNGELQHLIKKSAVSKRIDSNKRIGIADNSMLEYIFQRLYDTDDIEATINSIIEMIGKQINVSRVYVFENDLNNTECSNTFEWCNEGITPEKDNLQHISYETDIPNYWENFNERGIFYCEDVSKLPMHLREILEPQNIRSLLQCEIRDNGVFRGYVGFDECSNSRMWTKEQINQLTLLSQIITVFILKKRANEYSAVLNEDIQEILENQYAWVYVIDPVDFKINFLNSRTAEIAPLAKKGDFCYKVLMGIDEPCKSCPTFLNNGTGGSCDITNSYLNLTVKASASKIHWDGKKQWLITCKEKKQ